MGGNFTSQDEVGPSGLYVSYFTVTDAAVNNCLNILDDDGSLGVDIRCDGQIEWGDPQAFGSNDTNLYRSAANTLKTDDSLVVTGVGTGALGSYDATFGDVTTPDYGSIQVGSLGMYSSSYSTANIDLDKAFLFRQESNLGVGNDPGIEFAFMEQGNTIRMAIPESGAGNATAFIRSGTFAGPYTTTIGNDAVTCDQWTTYDSNIDCDTGGTGADLFVQDDLELEGELFVSGGSIKLDSDDANPLTISATSQTAAHGFDFPDDEIVDDDVLLGDGAGSFVYANMPDCNTNNMLTYTAATNTFGCDADDGAGAGEANTASSAGTGASVYYQKSGVDLQFNAFKSENSLLTVALDAVTHDIEFTVVEGNIDHDALTNFLANEHLDWTASVGTIHAGNVGAAHIDAIGEIATALKSGLDGELITGTIATTNAVLTVNADDDLVEEGTLLWNVTPATCTGDGNGGALTVNGSNQIVCSADDGGGGGGVSMVGFSSAAATIAKSTTAWVGAGSGNVSATEIYAGWYVSGSVTVKNLYGYASTVDASGSLVVVVRKNGAACTNAPTVTWAAGAPGAQSDTASTGCSAVAGDYITIQATNNASGGGARDAVLETVTLELS
jgi:hypothetical protein